MPNLKRQFAMIEIYIWKDPVFKALPESARMLWLHLMTSPRTTKLPGLLQASAITVMSDMGWDRPPEGQLRWSEDETLIRGIQRTNRAFTVLEHTLHESSKFPWVIMDREANLIILPRKVAHNIPGNPNIVQGWINELKEIPPSMGKDTWTVNTVQVLRTALGRDDKRVKALTESERLSKNRLGADCNRQYSPTDSKDTALSNGSGKESQKLSKDLDHRSEILDLRSGVGGGQAPSPHPATSAGAELDLVIDKDKTEPPPNASPRLLAIWNAMQNETFLVPGCPPQTLWQNSKHPREFAEKLDKSAPSVDVAALICTLAGWTYANPKRAKKDLCRFVWNAAIRDQDNPKTSNQSQPGFGSTLAEKVKRSREENR